MIVVIHVSMTSCIEADEKQIILQSVEMNEYKASMKHVAINNKQTFAKKTWVIFIPKQTNICL